MKHLLRGIVVLAAALWGTSNGLAACNQSIPTGHICIHGNAQGDNWLGSTTYTGDALLCADSDTTCAAPYQSITTFADLGSNCQSDFEFIAPASGGYRVRLTTITFNQNYTWDSPNSWVFTSNTAGQTYEIYAHATCTQFGITNQWSGCNCP